MTNVYLFDWGNTLMVDDPNTTGKMCYWPNVEAISGAKETLAALSKHAKLYIATGAADSSEFEIKLAFERVGLSEYISGYFCQANLGISKGSTAFISEIINRLEQPSENIAMVGDSFEKDIKPALATGIKPIWFTTKNTAVPKGVRVIHRLSELVDD
ncbi:MAG: HAD hydrolase-like protein [Psychrobium sp.]|nr:HAD hydrolase-like protein [Psychrobium sp.]